MHIQHFFSLWSKAAAFILAAACLVPGFSIFDLAVACEEAAAFGFFVASMEPFFHWIDMPVNPYTLGLGSALANVGLILWTSTIIPGFVVKGALSAVALIILLTVADVRAILGLESVPKSAALAALARSALLAILAWGRLVLGRLEHGYEIAFGVKLLHRRV